MVRVVVFSFSPVLYVLLFSLPFLLAVPFRSLCYVSHIHTIQLITDTTSIWSEELEILTPPFHCNKLKMETDHRLVSYSIQNIASSKECVYDKQ